MTGHRLAIFLLFVAAVLAAAQTTFASGGNASTGVQNTDGNPSPPAGSSQPGGHSNIDDYTQQDEQVNIDGDRDNVVKVLRVNQKNLINDYVVRMFPISSAPPIEMREVFRRIVALEGGRAEVIRDKKQERNWLWVVAPKFQIPHIEASVKELDVPWLSDDTDGSYEAYYKAKFRAIGAIDALASLPAAGADHVSVLDTVNNASLRIGEPYRTESYVKHAKEVDLPIPQVLLEGAIYEVEVSKEMRLGLDYMAWKNGPGRNLFQFALWGSSYHQSARHASSAFDPFLPAPGSGDTSGWYLGANYLITAAYLDFLEGVGRARLLTKGKVLIKNSLTGTISAVDQVLYFRTQPDETNTPTSGTNPGQVFVSTVGDSDGVPAEGGDSTDIQMRVYDRTLTKDTKVEVGFVLSVTPTIAEETTQLQLVLASNQIVGQTPSGAPQIRTYSLSTTVLVRDGQPFCVGGIRRTEDVKNVAKAPILGSVPVLGWLFGHEATVKRETEMIAVLVPKIRLGSEADLEMANDEDKLIRAQVERRAKLVLPKTEYGFDQWLLGKD